MVGTAEVFDALKSIGLNLYERKIFVALLAKGVATAAELSEIAKVPRSRSYDVLESLADKGFVMIQPSKPIKYVALKPLEALDRTKDKMQENHETMLDRIDRLQKSPILSELDKIFKQGLNLVQPAEMTGTLKGSSQINKQLQSIFKAAKNDINVLTTEKGLRSLHTAHYRILKKAAKSGIKIKISAPLANQELASAFAQIADVRNVKSPSARVMTIDNDHVVMALTDDNVHESQDVAFWANSQHAAKDIVKPYLSQVWASGTKK